MLGDDRELRVLDESVRVAMENLRQHHLSCWVLCYLDQKFPRVVLTIVLEYLAVVFVDLYKNSRKLEMEVKVLKDQRQKAGIRYINVDVTKRRQSKA